MSRPLPAREYLHLGEVAAWLGLADTRPLKTLIDEGLPVIQVSRKTKLVALDDLRAFLSARKRGAGNDVDELVGEILEGLDD